METKQKTNKKEQAQGSVSALNKAADNGAPKVFDITTLGKRTMSQQSDNQEPAYDGCVSGYGRFHIHIDHVRWLENKPDATYHESCTFAKKLAVMCYDNKKTIVVKEGAPRQKQRVDGLKEQDTKEKASCLIHIVNAEGTRAFVKKLLPTKKDNGNVKRELWHITCQRYVDKSGGRMVIFQYKVAEQATEQKPE